MSLEFGTRLRELRLAKELGLRQAAKKADIDYTLWSKFETGKRHPPNPTTKPEESEILISKLSRVLSTPDYDPYGELKALATLPEDVPIETRVSLENHFNLKRTFKK